ncbi:MAG: hypothetical protein Q8O95_02985 [bacterium]|nr:hypothetical protein [bacterium]
MSSLTPVSHHPIATLVAEKLSARGTSPTLVWRGSAYGGKTENCLPEADPPPEEKLKIEN